ncbi:MAG TPA: cyclodeaminase/cyclohydrolase family protein [Candidatus Hypogeohydataceae bacterium YC41]
MAKILYTKEPLERYLEDAAAGTPTPGGGSVSALVGALATTMASMAANMTVGRPEFKEVEAPLNEMAFDIQRMRKEFLELMHKDMDAYQSVLDTYRLPKSTPEEKSFRSQAIQAALKGAMEVPLHTARLSLNLLEHANKMVDMSNPNLLGDVIVAAVLAKAAFTGGRVNVEVNLSLIKDKDLVKNTQDEILEASKRTQVLWEGVMKKAEKAIAPPKAD